MEATDPSDALLRFFDPEDEVSVVERDLPHWMQAGTACFITWRTWDSIPEDWIDGWLSGRAAWLCRHGINPDSADCRTQLARLTRSQQREFHREFSARWEAHLDRCHGECVLRRPELARVVADSLRHFDGERYTLTDFVVMPNHVHLLAAFPTPESQLRQCESWKHFTATRINALLGRRGRFWQVDAFDHLVRSEARFLRYREYIAANPERAGLRPGEFVHYTKDLGMIAGGRGHSRGE